MEWTGGCLCGAVRYRTTAEPIRAVNCHCGMCRRMSGAAFLTHVHFLIGAFTWTKGKPTRYRFLSLARGFPAPSGGGSPPAFSSGFAACSRARGSLVKHRQIRHNIPISI